MAKTIGFIATLNRSVEKNLRVSSGFELSLRVHGKDTYGCPADRGQALDDDASHGEVIGPRIASRVEEDGDLIGLGVDSREIRSLVQVAMVTRQGKVARIIRPAMLLRGDVLDVESGQRDCRLGELTILATIPRSFPDQVASRGVHQECWPLASTFLAFLLKDADEVDGLDDGLVFGPLVGRELTFVALLGEEINSRLDFGARPEFDEFLAKSEVMACPTGSSN